MSMPLSICNGSPFLTDGINSIMVNGEYVLLYVLSLTNYYFCLELHVSNDFEAENKLSRKKSWGRLILFVLDLGGDGVVCV